MFYLRFQSVVIKQWLFFDQTFQISILWRPIIPIDRTTDIVAAVPALQTDDLNLQTTPDIRPHKSAMAGNDYPSTKSALTVKLYTDFNKKKKIPINFFTPISPELDFYRLPPRKKPSL